MHAIDRERNAEFAKGLARAYGGAVIFALPLLMTMEMWWFGFHMEPGRLLLLLVVFFPFLVALSWHSGFEPTFSWRDDVVDALVAFAVGVSASLVVLALLGEIGRDTAPSEVVGKVSLQAIPASMGALLAQTQFGEREPQRQARGGSTGYAIDLFIMAVGALFLAFNLAPTDEMVMIAARIDEWHAIVLMLLSVAIMEAFVYSLSFRGTVQRPAHAPGWSLFLRFTVVGYALALLLSAYMLWSFGRLDGLALMPALKAVAVLGFPAAVGAAAARLIL